ncbi:YqhR family membrane protein [Microbacteriaceae bacterium 4G12]
MENRTGQNQSSSFMKKVIQIGTFGGLFWGCVWYFLHIFSFSEVGPNYLLMSFALGYWKQGVWGNLIAIAVIGLLSIVIAILYGSFLKKLQGVTPGIVYGCAWWILLFIAVGSFSPVLKNALELQKATVVTTLCIFILYGVFIAYSISFEWSQKNVNNEMEEPNYSNKS